ncbi:hypothetical protein KRR39_10265 [Nocardioides panacis]|uniref:Uncharacterized protein n=1 Tax=Nocardioides panacis TaxID=2849501 RepID=A0A975T298_9ACTN|nr:hypothetical protein [Nocardioides panacis]QWZ10077.1 hypothetical protein KRR39_10265 [Nocardioides panacis]
MAGQEHFVCAHCGHSNALPEVKSRWASTGKVLTFLVAAASVLIAAFGTFSPVESTDIGKARAFLGAYYSSAPFQPERTWKRLSDSYKESGLSSGPLAWDEYSRYFSQFDEMAVSDVANYKSTRGEWYIATVYRKNKNGATATTRYAFELRCPWYSRLPRLSCSPSNMQIYNDCVINQASGRCKEDEASIEPPAGE